MAREIKSNDLNILELNERETIEVLMQNYKKEQRLLNINKNKKIICRKNKVLYLNSKENIKCIYNDYKYKIINSNRNFYKIKKIENLDNVYSLERKNFKDIFKSKFNRKSTKRFYNITLYKNKNCKFIYMYINEELPKTYYNLEKALKREELKRQRMKEEKELNKFKDFDNKLLSLREELIKRQNKSWFKKIISMFA